MNLTEEQLEELESVAGLFFSIYEIMIVLEIPVHMEEEFTELLNYKKENPIFKAYHKGRLTADIELRIAIKQAALNGSNPAQNSMREFYINSLPVL